MIVNICQDFVDIGNLKPPYGVSTKSTRVTTNINLAYNIQYLISKKTYILVNKTFIFIKKGNRQGNIIAL